MNEQETINRVQNEMDRKLRRTLSKVNRTGEFGRVSQDYREAMSINGLVEFGPPRPGINPYNCWRLTESGRKKLAGLNAKLSPA